MRPSSLSETARRIINGHPSPSPISEFLDEFYNARDDLSGRSSMLHLYIDVLVRRFPAIFGGFHPYSKLQELNDYHTAQEI
jgi:hypothetical protein